MKTKDWLWLPLRNFIGILESMSWCSDIFLMSDAWGGMVDASDVSVKTATIVCYDRSNSK